MLRSAHLILICAFVLLSGVVSSPGVEYSKSIFTKVWRSHDGMPGNEVTGIAQDGSGYLWLAYLNGVAKFDGVRFQSVSLPLPDEREVFIRQLLRTGGDRFWFAMDSGRVVCLSPTRTNVYTASDGLSSGRPLTIAEAHDGSVWIGYSDSTVCRILGRQVTRLTSREGLSRSGNCRVASDMQGQIWFAQSGRVGVWKEDGFQTLLRFPALEHLRVAKARNGGVWICSNDKVFSYKEGGDLVERFRLKYEREFAAPELMFEDRSGVLWVGTYGSGLFRCAGTNAEPVETSQRTIMSLYEDREGSLWAGTGGGGLNRLRPRILNVHGYDAGLPFETARSACEDAEGRIWAVGRNGALARFEKGNWRLLGAEDGWPGDPATCVAADYEGSIWIGTYRRATLFRWRAGNFSRIDKDSGLTGDTVRLLLPDRAGNLWIGTATPSGLQKLRLSDGKIESVPQPSGSRYFCAGAVDTAGNIWLGTMDGGLFRANGTELVDVSHRTVWNSDRAITSVSATPDGCLWIAYLAQGLGRLKAGRLDHVSPKQGLPEGRISGIMPDSNGGLWLSTDSGILRVSQEELNAVADGRAESLNAIYYGSDELLSLQGFAPYSPGAAKTRDGRILFPILTGLAVVHPERVSLNRKPPQIIIESAIADEQGMGVPVNGDRLRLGPGLKTLEFQLTAPSFIAPSSTRFRHQLAGVDEHWVDLGTQRRVTYTHLSPGSYSYRATACNYAGIWNEAGAQLDFEILPFFWQTAQFKVASTVIGSVAFFGLLRYAATRRLRMEVLRAQQEAALDRERARIAKDIHDDLGASLTQISLLSELAMRHLQTEQMVTGYVSKLANTARQAFTALDEIVWAVNPGNDSLPNLLDYIAQYALDFLSPTNVRCRLDFPAQPPLRLVTAEVRHTIFLVVKEVLNNVVKHASATEVRLAAAALGDKLCISMEDDGIGVEQNPHKPGSDGLKNMRQRVQSLNGTFEIKSAPISGTVIRIEIPLPIQETPKQESRQP